jgi:hypothetical protein
MTAGRYDFAFSRRDAPGVLHFVCPRKKRAQGRPDARCTRGLMCVSANKNLHMSIQVQLATPGLPCAMALRLIRGRPGDRLSCHRHPADCSAKLDASTGTSGPHDFTVRNSSVRLRCSRVHRISPHVRDDRERPSFAVRRAETITDLPDAESGIFLARALDAISTGLPVGQFGESWWQHVRFIRSPLFGRGVATSTAVGATPLPYPPRKGEGAHWSCGRMIVRALLLGARACTHKSRFVSELDPCPLSGVLQTQTDIASGPKSAKSGSRHTIRSLGRP